MPKYIAFLRAINVGGHNVKMDHLRQLFSQMGFDNVATFIASGNVIFDSPADDRPMLEQKIAASLQETLGYEVATFIRTIDEVTAIANYTPFSTEPNDSNPVLYIGFVAEPPTADAIQKLLTLNNEIDQFHVDNSEVYWLCRKSISHSNFSGALLEKTLSTAATLRNARTVRRIAAKFGE